MPPKAKASICKRPSSRIAKPAIKLDNHVISYTIAPRKIDYLKAVLVETNHELGTHRFVALEEGGDDCYCDAWKILKRRAIAYDGGDSLFYVCNLKLRPAKHAHWFSDYIIGCTIEGTMTRDEVNNMFKNFTGAPLWSDTEDMPDDPEGN